MEGYELASSSGTILAPGKNRDGERYRDVVWDEIETYGLQADATNTRPDQYRQKARQGRQRKPLSLYVRRG